MEKHMYSEAVFLLSAVYAHDNNTKIATKVKKRNSFDIASWRKWGERAAVIAESYWREIERLVDAH